MLHKQKMALVTKVTKGTYVQMNTSWVQNARSTSAINEVQIINVMDTANAIKVSYMHVSQKALILYKHIR